MSPIACARCNQWFQPGDVNSTYCPGCSAPGPTPTPEPTQESPAPSGARAKWLGTLGVLALIAAVVGVIVYLNTGEDVALLRKGLKEQQGIDAKTIDLGDEKDGIRFGTVTSEQRELHPIAVRFRTSTPGNTTTRSAEWILGPTETALKEEIGKILRQTGCEPASISLVRNTAGVGYSGTVTATTGEVFDVTEIFTGGLVTNLSSAHTIQLSPGSYPCWARNLLSRELKEEVAGVSDFQPKTVSWAKEERDRAKATGIRLNPADLVEVTPIGQRKEYLSATARTAAGKQLQLELEVTTSQPLLGATAPAKAGPSLNLRWKRE